MNAPTLTVEELNEYVRRSLASDPMLHSIRLRGEISNFKRHVSGHWYFSLKDAQSAIACVMFRSAAGSVHFAPKDGMRVVLRGSVGLYAKTGSYQFYADGMEQDGIGELYLRMEALKSTLSKEGLFDATLKKPLPLLPKGIGIATSGTGAVIHDISRVAWRRHPGMPLYLYPVAVQGEGAAQQIAQALRVLDTLGQIDVIIVGRGGGSMEDLWPFNEEVVARSIAACHKPVISAVGHETDFTIADFVSDVRAPTPSAAAELAVPQVEALQEDVEAMMRRIKRAADAEIAEKTAALTQLQRRIAEQTPANQLQAITERVISLSSRITMIAQAQIDAMSHRAAQATIRLSASGPKATLQRGYALVTQNGHIIPSVQKLKPDNDFTVTLKDGKIDAKAISVRKEDES